MQKVITQVRHKPFPIWEYIGNASEGAEVDNYVQDPWRVVSYNRYAYVWNNPVR